MSPKQGIDTIFLCYCSFISLSYRDKRKIEISKALIEYFEIRSNISMFLAYAGLDNLGGKTYLKTWICLLKAQNIISGR